MKSTEHLLENYLKKNDINVKVADYVNVIPEENEFEENLNDALFDNIIVDGFNGFSEDVKYISNYVTENFKIFFGRREKIIIKNVIDYEFYDLLSSINTTSEKNIDLKKTIKNQRSISFEKINSCKRVYFDSLTHEIAVDNKNRISDYINFLYSKALIHNEFKKRSVYDIFCENEAFLAKETKKQSLKNFKNICLKNKTKLTYKEAVEKFNKLYEKEILDNGTKLNEVIAINLDQYLFNSFRTKDEFISYIFSLFRNAHKELQNHRTLVLKIENIIINGINIKWELYSYLTIYAENFIQYQESRQYFKPEDICIDFIEHKYQCFTSEETRDKLKNYYKNTIDFIELTELVELGIHKKEIDFFKNVYNGFQFIDCLILKSDSVFENSEEINFIENKNELLLIFSKHEIDDRKIPCPVCASLKISGNSYPAVGIKSWECKNDLCSERSKTNRGKRYSSRSNDMQTGVSDEQEANLISKDLVSKWRRDIVTESSVKTIFEMIIKYFSYQGANISFYNFNPKFSQIPKELYQSRNISFYNLFEKFPTNIIDKNTFSLFLKSELLSKFLYNNDIENKITKLDLTKIEDYEIINSDCLSYLRTLPANSIGHMVTSPPYYNAREYSQWKNLYNYLNDMFKICLASFEAIKPGGVFFYNIGDIFDNPNTIVKSKMGEKRLALGAYLILLFKSAGFELLDNIIWDKGETQSNRHKNDGNFTPYYQRPANCYEHMFVFKKPGKLSVCNKPLLKENIQKFPPVIKINSKGENLFGHTAPYPPELPLISIKTFTNEGDIVFDPFLGSGTTVYTAVLNGRKGIGTEMDSVYYNLANSYVSKKINDSFQIELFQ